MLSQLRSERKRISRDRRYAAAHRAHLGAINQTDRANLPGNGARNNNKITLTINEVEYAFCKVDRIQKSAMVVIGFDG